MNSRDSFQLELEICAKILTSFRFLCVKLLLVNMQPAEAATVEPVLAAPAEKFRSFLLSMAELLFILPEMT